MTKFANFLEKNIFTEKNGFSERKKDFRSEGSRLLELGV